MGCSSSLPLENEGTYEGTYEGTFYVRHLK